MKRILLTDRDQQIIDFLSEYKCANTSSIADIFFNGSKRPCSRRLQLLREHGFIKSSQEFVCLEQIHYINRKPTQLKHSSILSTFIGLIYKKQYALFIILVKYIKPFLEKHLKH